MVVPVATVAAAHPVVPDHAGRGDGCWASLASVGGLVLAAYASFYADVAPGPTIVLLSLAGFALTWPLGVLAAAPAAAARAVPGRPMPDGARRPSTETHAHEHGAGLRPPGRPARRPRRLRPRRPPARRPRRATMTSTEPALPRRRARPGSGGRSPRRWQRFDDFRSRPGDPRPAAAPRRRRSGWPPSTGPCRRCADAGEVDMLRTEDGEAIYRRCSDDPPPPPGLPLLRRDRRGRGPGRRALDRRRSPPSTASPTSATPWRSSAPAPPARARPR